MILSQNRLAQMGIPAEAADAIRAAWNSEPPALYGRLDLAYDGKSIKLLEYNADTPTGLVEAAIAQWYWLQDCFPDADREGSLKICWPMSATALSGATGGRISVIGCALIPVRSSMA